MTVPAIVFGQTGVVIPLESDILIAVQADNNAAFGGGLSASLTSPQGQLAQSLTKVIGDKNDQILNTVNNFDPNKAAGIWQDAIGNIYGQTRIPGTGTTVACVLYGLTGTIIPVGTLAQDTSGNIYALTGTVTIDGTGQVAGTFQNIVFGSIACPIGTLTVIYARIIGWDSLTNPSAGIAGRLVESRSDFEFRRKNSVSINAQGTSEAIYANVFNVANVGDVYVTQNRTSAAITVGSTAYSLLPHSIYVAAVGGLDASIAQAIWQKTSGGADFNGNTSVSVTDQSGYNYPYPTYAIKFNRPSSLPVKFAINIVNNAALPSNIVALIQAAVIASFTGTDGGQRERIGSIVYASRYYASLLSIGVPVSIISILVGSPTANANQLSVGIDQAPTLVASDIVVTLT
jgi:hypothetical protein